jgi:hypothetical protein
MSKQAKVQRALEGEPGELYKLVRVTLSNAAFAPCARADTLTLAGAALAALCRRDGGMCK